MKHPVAGLGVMLIWLAVAGRGQAPAPAQSPADTGLKIVANTEEVALDLVVRDKKGRPVADLKPEDLEIKDDGKPVKLSGLRPVSGPAEAGASAGATVTDPLRSMRLVTFVFERIGPDSGRLAREAANEMIKTSTGEKVYFAVLQIDGSLRLVQGFTADLELLRKAIRTVTGSARANKMAATRTAQSAMRSIVSNPAEYDRASQGDLTAVQGPPGTQQMVQMLRNTIRMSEQLEREEQARPTLDALLTIARQEAAMPGRKTVVYFCEGMRITMATKQMMRTIIGMANRANISFYTVDAGGLSSTLRNEAARTMLASAAQASFNAMTQNGPQAVASGGPPPEVGGPNPRAVTRDEMVAFDRAEQAMNDNSQAPLMELAESTGGFYIGDSNDLRKPARRLMQDLANYYEAYYAPAISPCRRLPD
jgi:VWFA-related protein